MNNFKSLVAAAVLQAFTVPVLASSLNSLTEQNIEVLLSSNQVVSEAAKVVSDSMILANTAMQQLGSETPDFLVAAAQLGDAKNRVESTIKRLETFEQELLREANALPKRPLSNSAHREGGVFDSAEGIATIRQLFTQNGTANYSTANARHFAARVEQYRHVNAYLRRQLPDLTRAVFQEDAVAYQQVVRQVINALSLDRELISTYTVLLQRGENPVSIAALTLPEVGQLYSVDTAVSTVEMIQKRVQNGGNTDTTFRHGQDPFAKLDKR